MNEEQGTRIPFASIRNALVLFAPSRSGAPYSRAPGVISLEDQGRLRPARLGLKHVEYLPEEAIGIIQRIEIGSANAVVMRVSTPKSRRMRYGHVQIDDVGLAVGERRESVLAHVLHGRNMA